jgi:hypothetical protein
VLIFQGRGLGKNQFVIFTKNRGDIFVHFDEEKFSKKLKKPIDK